MDANLWRFFSPCLTWRLCKVGNDCTHKRWAEKSRLIQHWLETSFPASEKRRKNIFYNSFRPDDGIFFRWTRAHRVIRLVKNDSACWHWFVMEGFACVNWRPAWIENGRHVCLIVLTDSSVVFSARVEGLRQGLHHVGANINRSSRTHAFTFFFSSSQKFIRCWKTTKIHRSLSKNERKKVQNTNK